VVQMAEAMAYLEERRIVHRDLAIRNILLAHVDLVRSVCGRGWHT